MELLLLDIEAELAIWEEGQVVWSEEAFPVAELAYHLALWLRSPAAGAEDFELDSMQAGPGLIRIVGTDGGWRIGSSLTPDFVTSPVAWDDLVAGIKHSTVPFATVLLRWASSPPSSRGSDERSGRPGWA